MFYNTFEELVANYLLKTRFQDQDLLYRHLREFRNLQLIVKFPDRLSRAQVLQHVLEDAQVK